MESVSTMNWLPETGEWRHKIGSRNLIFVVVLVTLMSTITSPVLCNYATEDYAMGINYGQVGNNLPSPSEGVALASSLGIGRVRLFNPDAPTLVALGGSGLQVVVGMGNDVISSLTNLTSADQWILQNVVPYVPSTNITTILVGNELFTDTTLNATWLQLVPAMRNLQSSLQSRGLGRIKLSTAAELNTLGWSYPPSKGVFRTDIAVPVMTPLLQFLNETDSYLYINVYPYFGWRDDSSYIPFDYALFTRTIPFIVDGTHSYYNLLDAQLDAMAAAIELLGFGNVRLAISETGWPTIGGAGSNGTDPTLNAKTYNTNLIKNILGRKGTPRRPGVFVPTFIFALFNENLKPGGVAEQNWGVLYPNGSQVYSLPWKAPNGTAVVSPVASPAVAVAVAVASLVSPSAAAPSPGPPESSATCTAALGGLSVALTLFVAFLNFYM